MAIYKLDKISFFQNGSTPSTKIKKFWKKEIPFLCPADLNENRESRWISKSYGKSKKCGTILISTTATIGNMTILKKESWFNQQITSIKAKTNIIYDKYLYYFFRSKQEIIKKMTGSGSIFTILPISTFKDWKINVPKLSTQQQIIDIIEPNEKLFLSYPNCVRIDTHDNAKNDMKLLIDIIEPIENISLIINKMINEIKKLLIKKYNLCQNNFVRIEKLSNLKNKKWNNQKFYYDTSAINEFKINYEKRIDISNNKPSRADLSPVKNSFLLSKLLGENKIYFVINDQENVFSTGFLNLTTKCIDHISGFFLSNEFKNQKNYLSTGTTMVGLNNTNFKKILVKNFQEKNHQLTFAISKLIGLFNYLNLIKKKIINILIK